MVQLSQRPCGLQCPPGRSFASSSLLLAPPLPPSCVSAHLRAGVLVSPRRCERTRARPTLPLARSSLSELGLRPPALTPTAKCALLCCNLHYCNIVCGRYTPLSLSPSSSAFSVSLSCARAVRSVTIVSLSLFRNCLGPASSPSFSSSSIHAHDFSATS